MIPKFRAWNIESQCMLNHDFIVNTVIHNGEIVRDFSDILEHDDIFILMQSTGLHDKNGKEIFEGDIFKAPFDIGPAGFSMSKGVVEYDLEQGYQWQHLLLSELEIMGNIYENPELLEKENDND